MIADLEIKSSGGERERLDRKRRGESLTHATADTEEERNENETLSLLFPSPFLSLPLTSIPRKIWNRIFLSLSLPLSLGDRDEGRTQRAAAGERKGGKDAGNGKENLFDIRMRMRERMRRIAFSDRV